MQNHDHSFGAQLRRYRERAGLTQDALAERAGLTTNAISALESGARQRPYPHTVHALTQALQLSAVEQAALLAARRPLRQTPPPAVPPAVPASLPAVLTPLVGRDQDVAALTHLVARPEVRLVTIVGPGGVGKTRVAVELASTIADQFPHGVTWVSLAAVTDPALVVPAGGQGRASLGRDRAH